MHRTDMETPAAKTASRQAALRPASTDDQQRSIVARVQCEYAARLRDVLAADDGSADRIAEAVISGIMAADQDGGVIGTIACAATDRDVGSYWYSVYPGLGAGRVHYLFIAPAFRRMGYGKSAIAAIHGQLAERGCNRAELNVLASNAAALALYASLGYEIDSHEMICPLPRSAPQGTKSRPTSAIQPMDASRQAGTRLREVAIARHCR